MIVYRPGQGRLIVPGIFVPAGAQLSAEDLAAQQPGPNVYNAYLDAQAAQARTLTQSILRRTSTSTTPGGAWILPPPEPFHRPFNVAVLGDNLIVAGSEGLKIDIHQIELWNTVLQTIRLLDGTVDLLGPLVNFPAGAGLNLRWQDEPHFKLSYGQPFQINLTAGQVTGFLKYRMME